MVKALLSSPYIVLLPVAQYGEGTVIFSIHCVEDIRQWMENNLLKLNDSKTEFIICGTPKNVGKIAECIVVVGDAIILPSGSVRNIGAMLNPTLNMETHIISMKRTCYL